MNRDHEIEVVLRDAATMRRCGTAMSDERALKEALAEALDKIDVLEDNGCEHGDCEECEDIENAAELTKDCGLNEKERGGGTSCKNGDGENCAECRVHDGLKDVRADIAELQAKYDKALDELIDLRSRPSDADCGLADIDRAHGKACKSGERCWACKLGASVTQQANLRGRVEGLEGERDAAAAQLSAVLVELGTKTRALEFVTAERDRLLLETQQSEKKPAPARRLRQPSIDPAQVNLFELVKKAAESKVTAAPPAKRKPGRPRKAAPSSASPTEDA